jgi:hypothetical protein
MKSLVIIVLVVLIGCQKKAIVPTPRGFNSITFEEISGRKPPYNFDDTIITY